MRGWQRRPRAIFARRFRLIPTTEWLAANSPQKRPQRLPEASGNPTSAESLNESSRSSGRLAARARGGGRAISLARAARSRVRSQAVYYVTDAAYAPDQQHSYRRV